MMVVIVIRWLYPQPALFFIRCFLELSDLLLKSLTIIVIIISKIVKSYLMHLDLIGYYYNGPITLSIFNYCDLFCNCLFYRLNYLILGFFYFIYIFNFYFKYFFFSLYFDHCSALRIPVMSQ